MTSMWEKVIKGCSLAVGAAAGIFGEWTMLLTVLVIAMSLDYLSGVIVAAAGRSPKSEGGGLDSKAGFVGLAKKGFIVIMVLLATLLDRALGTDAMVFQTATVCYYIANEGISVVENAGLMRLPVPGVIKHALEQMREKHDFDE